MSKNFILKNWLHAERFVLLIQDLKSYFAGFLTQRIMDQNKITGTRVENEEATANTPKASVDKEQPW